MTDPPSDLLKRPLSGDDPQNDPSAHGVDFDALKATLIRRNPDRILESIHLPIKFERLTNKQFDAIEEILWGFKYNKVVVLDAPTGSGKTVIGETIRQLLGYRGLYVCHSKTLQDQFFTDFQYSAVLKGRNNYLPQRRLTGVTCADCNKYEQICSWCPDSQNCSYEIAKKKAISNPIAILNSTYFLTECNGPGKFSKRQFGILDEADTLESELMRYVEIRVTPTMQKRFQLFPPTKITKEDAWRDWVGSAINIISPYRISLGTTEQNVQLIRRAKYVENLYSRLHLLRDGIEEGDWIYTGGKNIQDIGFKPVTVDRLGREYLWGHCGQFLLMSASVISSSQMLDDLGYDGDFHSVSMPSGFDIKTREIKVCPVANMSRAGNEREELLQGINRIIKRHPSERLLLHTVSYDLADWLVREISNLDHGRSVITYRKASERDAAIAKYRRSPGAILIAPSLDRGVDFKDDDCRVNIICKVPYPYLGDKQVSKRLYSPGGQMWYNVQTVRTIIQMTGRATRHKDDWSVNYILDKQFSSLWSKCKNLFPKWWVDAIDWRDRLA